MAGPDPLTGERPDRQRQEVVVGPDGETRSERQKKDLGLLAAAGSGAGCLILALPVLGLGALVWLAWKFVLSG